MVWAKLDDEMHTSRKVARLSDAAFRLWVLAVATSHRSPGIDLDAISRPGRKRDRSLRELHRAGLAHPTGSGWELTDVKALWCRGSADRRIVPADVRRAVLARDGNHCGICGGHVPDDDIHLDHIRPVARGGPTVANNLQVTHSRCNIRKGASWLG